uniref:Uncharacterized protein n=1 Tax=Meloidogyne enterolobii TaxID=390850 RepID=A0A6V7VHM8_MELEN|nr:unnamed protein product [Meloidogyne enterolobii]
MIVIQIVLIMIYFKIYQSFLLYYHPNLYTFIFIFIFVASFPNASNPAESGRLLKNDYFFF